VVTQSSFANVPLIMTASILRRMATQLTCNGVAAGNNIDPDLIRVVGGTIRGRYFNDISMAFY
jgi:hypothetical protein